MCADLSRDPDELDRIAHLLSDLAADLVGALGTVRAGIPEVNPAGAAAGEHAAAARRIADELDATAAVSACAAAAGRRADADAAAGLLAAASGGGRVHAGQPAAGPEVPRPGRSAGVSPAEPLSW